MLNDRPRRVLAIIGSMIFLVIAPMTVAGLVPWWITRWRTEPSVGDLPVVRAVGVLLILVGVPVLLDSFARFAIQGLGTRPRSSQRAISSSRDSIATYATQCTLQW